MKRQPIIIYTVATALVVLAVALLTIHHHRTNKREVLSRFQDHQLAHAQHLANQIKFFFHARSQELQALSSLLPRGPSDLKQKKADIETSSKMMEYVKSISLCDETGKIIYSTDSNAIGLNYADREFFSWAKKKENKGKVSGSSRFQSDPSIFLLVVPLYRNSSNGNRSAPGERFDGRNIHNKRRRFFLLFCYSPIPGGASERFHQPPPSAWNNAAVSAYRLARACTRLSTACSYVCSALSTAK